jgi:2-polyprenyl-3-methyl-5-hydroxy-6-metoxy-1,4-benzoquinol methylase
MGALSQRLAVTWGHRWRRERYQRFVSLCAVGPHDSIVDIGAGRGGALAVFNDVNPITEVDVRPYPEAVRRPNISFVRADGCDLPFPDDEFDVAFSNSVIEHVPPERQALFAAEIRRVAHRYFVQTPNKWFLIEPHYQVPLFQFLPRRCQRFLNGHFSLGWQKRGHWEEITLLSARDVRRLFPDAEIHRERLFGLTKSLMAVRR